MAYWLQWFLCYGSKMNETVGGDLRTEDDSFYLLRYTCSKARFFN
ncbi:hypothetical protein EUBHAL_02373 [Anaerobutyricum hallii DSM 3353]|uniref:Uncharacterized protein n=1 Tax=Anaerobutyricum hallii DSM 3353 TaxID=411469 RepID=C0EY71_9FIRM|nr:hypothetical protein EUBHAL_02373 [Anaerobutyricum hallii DSM 3353]